MDFADKSVLITGASSGIGRAAALAFARQGATVGVNHLAEADQVHDMQQALANAPGKVIELEADAGNAAAVTAMVETFVAQAGAPDILVNNAGISLVKPFLETSEEDWDRILNTDLKSVFLMCKACLPMMLERGGVVINIASELAYTGRPHFAPYTAAKGGVISLTRSLALEFAPRIRVNGVAPGPTLTPMLKKEMAVPGHDESLDDIPLARYAEPEEIADTILFLASDRARYYCGEILSPNGGTLMR